MIKIFSIIMTAATMSILSFANYDCMPRQNFKYIDVPVNCGKNHFEDNAPISFGINQENMEIAQAKIMNGCFERGKT